MADYDLLSADFYCDPYPILAEMRREDPCWFDHRLGAFVLTRYGDVARVLQGEDFSAQRVRQFTRGAPDHLRAKVEAYVDALERWLLFVDPPHHTRLRARLQRAFGPALLPVIGAATRDAVQAALDELDGAGSADVIAAFAYPVPTRVLARVFGISDADIERFKRWTSEIFALIGAGVADANAVEAGYRGVVELRDYVLAMLAEKRRTPSDDMLSALARPRGEESENEVDDEDLVGLFMSMIVAGHETSTNLIGNALRAVMLDPALRERVCGPSELPEAAVEEFVRFDGPVASMLRRAKRDIVIAGTFVPEGSFLFSMLHLGEPRSAPVPVARPPGPRPTLARPCRFRGRHASLRRRLHGARRWCGRPFRPSRDATRVRVSAMAASGTTTHRFAAWPPCLWSWVGGPCCGLIEMRDEAAPLPDSASEAARLLAAAKPFDRLSDEARLSLAGHARERRFMPGEMIVREGEPGEEFFLVADGAVHVLGRGFDGTELVLARLEAGSCFGEQALLADRPCAAQRQRAFGDAVPASRPAAACARTRPSTKMSRFWPCCGERERPRRPSAAPSSASASSASSASAQAMRSSILQQAPMSFARATPATRSTSSSAGRALVLKRSRQRSPLRNCFPGSSSASWRSSTTPRGRLRSRPPSRWKLLPWRARGFVRRSTETHACARSCPRCAPCMSCRRAASSRCRAVALPHIRA